MSAASSARHLFCEAWSPAAGPPCDPFHYGMRSGPSCALLPWGQPTGRSKPAWNKGLERGPLRGCGHNASPSIRTGPVSPQLFWKDGGKKGQDLRTQPSAEETEQRPGGNASVIHQTGFTEPRESPSCKVGLLGAAAEGWRPAEEGGIWGPLPRPCGLKTVSSRVQLQGAEPQTILFHAPSTSVSIRG